MTSLFWDDGHRRRRAESGRGGPLRDVVEAEDGARVFLARRRGGGLRGPRRRLACTAAVLVGAFLVIVFWLSSSGGKGPGSAEKNEVLENVFGIAVPFVSTREADEPDVSLVHRPGGGPAVIVPWWRCAGSRWFEERINSHNAASFTTTDQVADPRIGGGYGAMFRLRTVQKVATGMVGSELAALDEAAPLVQLQEWPTSRGPAGVGGLVDLNFPGPAGGVKTFEYFDDLAREPRVWRRDDLSSGADRVVIITTCYRRPDQMRRFASSFRDLLRQHGDQNVIALMVLFGEEESLTPAERAAKSDMVSLGATVIHHELPFAKVSAMTKAMQHSIIDPNDILFFVDIDITFPPTLAQLARRFCRPGTRGFAPVVWYRGVDESSSRVGQGFAEAFAMGGTGVIALYKKDVEAFGGFDQEAFGSAHGFEDTDFFFRARYHGLHLVRYPVRALEHWPHSRNTWQNGTDEDTDGDAPAGCKGAEQLLRERRLEGGSGSGGGEPSGGSIKKKRRVRRKKNA